MAKIIFGLLIVISNITWAVGIECFANKSAKSPSLGVIRDKLYLSWTEISPKPQILISSLEKKQFVKPALVVQSSNLISNWADSGKFFSLLNGETYFWWPEKSASGVNGYDLMLAKSFDQGKTWRPFGKINSDSSPTEHGFTSMVEDSGKLRVIWVDGRDTVQGGASSLRSVVVTDKLETEELLDTRVCDCCGTSTVSVKNDFFVFYRGRTSEEVRDIQITKRIDGKWRVPTAFQVDKWKLSGCPMMDHTPVARGILLSPVGLRNLLIKHLSK